VSHIPQFGDAVSPARGAGNAHLQILSHVTLLVSQHQQDYILFQSSSNQVLINDKNTSPNRTGNTQKKRKVIHRFYSTRSNIFY